jgi:hypothetical protein
MLVLAILNEAYTKRIPLIPPSLFKDRTTAGLLVATFLHGMAFGAAPYFLPLYFQAINGASPRTSGVQIIPIALISILTFLAATTIVDETGDYRWVLWISSAVLTLGIALFSADRRCGTPLQSPIRHSDIHARGICCDFWPGNRAFIPDSNSSTTSSNASLANGGKFSHASLSPGDGLGNWNYNRRYDSEQSVTRTACFYRLPIYGL